MDDLMRHRYNLLTLKRLKRYSEELDFEAPNDAVEGLWETVYVGKSEEEKRELLSAACLDYNDVPIKFT